MYRSDASRARSDNERTGLLCEIPRSSWPLYFHRFRLQSPIEWRDSPRRDQQGSYIDSVEPTQITLPAFLRLGAQPPGMCLILIGYRVRDDHPLVIAANRDEYFERPTKQAHFWNDHPDIFAGRDEEEHGTWMGVTRAGRMAAVTNWTETEPNGNADLSRGHLVADFLRGRDSADGFVDAIEGLRYRGFNFIAFDGDELVYFSNRTSERRTLEPGIYGLSNTRLGDKWLRVLKGERKLSDQIEHPVLETLIHTLFDPHGVEFHPAPEKHNAPCFILGERYGTRSTTAMILGEATVDVREQTYGPMGKELGVVEEHFELKEH